MPCPRGPPVLLPFRTCPAETTGFPHGLKPPRGGVPRGLQPHVEAPPEEHGPGASRAFGRRVHGHVSPEGRLRRPGVAAAARAVDVDDREGATCGHHIEGHGLARHDVHDVSNFLHGEYVRPKGNQEPAAHRHRRRRLGIHPRLRMIPVVTPLILRVYHTLRVLQAGLLEEAQDGTLGLHDARRHRLTVEHTWGHWYAVPPHRALDIPGHRRSGVGGGAPSRLHVRTRAPAGSGSLDERGPPAGPGGPPAPGAGGWRGGPWPRGPPPEAAVAGWDPADAAGTPFASPPDVLAAVPPAEVTAPRRAAGPIAPGCAADCDAPRPSAGRAPEGSVSALDLAWADANGPA